MLCLIAPSIRMFDQNNQPLTISNVKITTPPAIRLIKPHDAELLVLRIGYL